MSVYWVVLCIYFNWVVGIAINLAGKTPRPIPIDYGFIVSIVTLMTIIPAVLGYLAGRKDA